MSENIKDGLTGCSREESYEYPREEILRDSLSRFMDRKFGLMAHFGVYSQMGIIESWPLSDADAPWARVDDWTKDGDDYRRQYFNLARSFNPARFNPDEWCDLAVDSGFKYILFTTKHMDGFCLYDSKYTDYKTTSPDCAFSIHPYADIVKHLFNAARKHDLGISAYYCKPDFHCPWYWAQGQARPVGFDRNANYSPLDRPDLWNQYVAYVHNQVTELVQNYGPLDVMWLDGAQVLPDNGLDARVSELSERLRLLQPNLLVADRMAGGRYENFITPEQSIPTRLISVPWESCVTLGEGWGYRYDDDYKPARKVIAMLVDVLAFGGNLALNVGPQPDGRMPGRAAAILRDIGAWLRENGEAIYGTRPVAPHKQAGVAFTQKASSVFALIPLCEGETLRESLLIPWQGDARPALMDHTPLPSAREAGGLRVSIPERMRGSSPLALTLRVI